VLLAHGSPDPRSARAVRAAAVAVAARTGGPVTAAFLDHDAPDLRAAVPGTLDDDQVVVLPLLLSRAFHARVDVPAAVASLSRPVTLLDPVGHPPGLLDALLLRAAGLVVVVSAGTRADGERQAFETAVAASAARTGVPAVAAYATGPGPRLAEAVPPGATVVPWLLAPGRLLDDVRRAARAHDCRTLGRGLLREPVLLDALADRLGVSGPVPVV
jgi:sirohydrochlorin ferrochelatase